MREKRLYSLTLLLISAACQATEPVVPTFEQPSYQECFEEFQKSLKVEMVGLELEAQDPESYQQNHQNGNGYKTRIKVDRPEPEVWVEIHKEPKAKDPEEDHYARKRKICKTIYGLNYR